MRTRIKICGLTREADVAAACAAGADAVGFNCYPKSPRYVDPHRLHALARHLGPFTVPVLLFVNAASDLVDAAREAIPAAVLQFHGDEHEADCARYGAAYVRAIRMSEGVDLLDCERLFPSAAALLLDAPSAVYGGSGEAFDWSRIPRERMKRPPKSRRFLSRNSSRIPIPRSRIRLSCTTPAAQMSTWAAGF